MSGKTGKYNDKSNGWETLVPRAIYFYYRTAARVRVYMWVEPDNNPVTKAEMHEKVKELIKNAEGDGKEPGPIGFDFDEVPWWRRSYLVFAVEGADAIDPTYPMIHRDERHPNHCFFDGGYEKDVDAGVPNKVFSYVWTVNYMKNKSGEDIPPRKIHKFKFQFTKKMIADGDEDHGTNMGPPIGPP